MKNNLQALNDYLFEQLERLNDDEITEQELEREIKKSVAVTSIAQTLIESGKLALKAREYADEYGVSFNDSSMPTLLANDK